MFVRFQGSFNARMGYGQCSQSLSPQPKVHRLSKARNRHPLGVWSARKLQEANGLLSRRRIASCTLIYRQEVPIQHVTYRLELARQLVRSKPSAPINGSRIVHIAVSPILTINCRHLKPVITVIVPIFDW
jgi:hypothetical protein